MPPKKSKSKTKSRAKPKAKSKRITVRFDRWLSYRDLTELLKSWAAKHKDLVKLESIGKTYEGRDIWLASITDRSTGEHDTKPAVWVDANIHATELTGSAAAVYLINTLLKGHKKDEKITRALRTRTFYVVPRISADGAEEAMADSPRYVRSSTRPYPRGDQQDGLVPEDVDGDGRILTMRVLDDNGAWKPFADDARMLVPREPDEDGPGPYYRLITEGFVQNYDGVTVRHAPALASLDINRNYPADWKPASGQAGAGPYPTSEPEIRAVVDAMLARKNVCTYLQYHTYSGVHLRPPCAHPDKSIPTVDLRVMKELGKKAEELTGYPMLNVNSEFVYDPKDVINGVSLDWVYDHLGILAWVTEFWNPLVPAGIEYDRRKPLEWRQEHPISDDAKLLAWADEHVPDGYVDWYGFDHPQLGPLEIGGWDTAQVWRNPPLHLLEDEISKHADWAIHNALITPRLTLREATATPVGGNGDGTYRVRLVVQNTGWLPTHVTQKARERQAVRPIEMEITVPKGAEVVGDATVEIGQLHGRILKNSAVIAGMDGTADLGKADWVVAGSPGQTVTLEARHERAGTVQASVVLPG